MNRIRFDNPVPLLVMFLLLQLGGQTAAGFSGRTGGFINIFTFISYCCLILRAFIWMLVLRRLSLSAAYPFTGAVYLLILPLSMLIFDEKPGWARFAGALLIFAGIIFTAAGASKNA